MTIDEMIKQGMTLPEIQKEVRRQVAVRDETSLKTARIEKARAEVVAAIRGYFDALGIPTETVDDNVFVSVFAEFEKNLATTNGILDQLSQYLAKEPEKKVKPEKKENDLESTLAMLRLFADNL